MDIQNLIKIEYHGERVLTTKQIADAYGCDISNIRHNFNQNKEQFIEGVHYFFLQGAELKEFKSYFADLQAAYNGSIKTHAVNFDDLQAAYNGYIKNDAVNFDGVIKTHALDLPFTKMASSLYLWTLQGAARHCKLVGTQKAWDVFTILENSYFDKSKLQDSIPPLELNLSPLDKFNFEKAKLLIRAAEMTDDKNLRDALIKSALELLD